LVHKDGLVRTGTRLAGGVRIEEQAGHALPVLVPRLAALGRWRHGHVRLGQLPRAPGGGREDLQTIVGAERGAEVPGQHAIETEDEDGPARTPLAQMARPAGEHDSLSATGDTAHEKMSVAQRFGEALRIGKALRADERHISSYRAVAGQNANLVVAR